MIPDVLDLCRSLIELDTQNPPGNESRVGDLVGDVLSAHGFQVRTVAATPGRDNVVASLTRGPGPRVILQGHADTKPAGDLRQWTSDPFDSQIRDGRLYGLGACDTKGGLAAFVAAACELAENPAWTGELIVQSVADEEDGSVVGAAHLLAQGELTADAAIVAEPTGCVPSLAQLGNAWAEIEITGRAAHAGTPDEGVDAFRAAVGYVTALEERVARLPRSADFPGHPRLNVGHLDLPGHPGTVPGRCTLRCDIRVMPGTERDSVFTLYSQAAEDIGTEGLSIEVRRYQGGGFLSHSIATDHPLALAFQDAQRDTGRPMSTLPFLGATDARFFGQAGTPAVVYGPGSLRRAHAPDEYVPIEELHLAHKQITAVLRTLLG
ncbi:M20 family metallopeptidase [Lentzea sp. JNUCC 0626]|uniref:M20 family metallopeptidase n=1 Tax=Lentzea sp. JNUCC 0626 TaxID=3367513 RepID=UPI003749D525